MALTINPLITGRLLLDKGAMTYFVDYGQPLWVPIVMWHIKAGDKNILVDSSASNDILAKHWPMGSADIVSFEEALGTVGITPDDVDIILQTHLHFDHCGNNAKCKKAEHIVQADELEFARNPHPLFGGNYAGYLLEGVEFTTIKGDKEIVPGVSVVRTPGHTPGCQAVMVDTEAGKAAISGFCCTDEAFNPPEAYKGWWPVITPGIHVDACAAFDSVLKVKELADITIGMHEINYAKLKSIPGDGSSTAMARWWEENAG